MAERDEDRRIGGSDRAEDLRRLPAARCDVRRQFGRVLLFIGRCDVAHRGDERLDHVRRRRRGVRAERNENAVRAGGDGRVSAQPEFRKVARDDAARGTALYEGENGARCRIAVPEQRDERAADRRTLRRVTPLRSHELQYPDESSPVWPRLGEVQERYETRHGARTESRDQFVVDERIVASNDEVEQARERRRSGLDQPVFEPRPLVAVRCGSPRSEQRLDLGGRRRGDVLGASALTSTGRRRQRRGTLVATFGRPAIVAAALDERRREQQADAGRRIPDHAPRLSARGAGRRLPPMPGSVGGGARAGRSRSPVGAETRRARVSIGGVAAVWRGASFGTPPPAWFLSGSLSLSLSVSESMPIPTPNPTPMESPPHYALDRGFAAARDRVSPSSAMTRWSGFATAPSDA